MYILNCINKNEKDEIKEDINLSNDKITFSTILKNLKFLENNFDKFNDINKHKINLFKNITKNINNIYFKDDNNNLLNDILPPQTDKKFDEINTNS